MHPNEIWRKLVEVFNENDESRDFSIITPTRNADEFILNCLKSVQNQKIGVEHLIQDANSNDQTVSVITNFGKSNPSVTLVSERDLGQSDALNKLLKRASGKYIGWLNADETYLPGTLEAVKKLFEKTSADVIYGDCLFVDANQKLIRLYSNHKFSIQILRNYGCYIPSCATFFRASIFEKINFDLQLKRAMDWDLYLNIRDKNFRYLRRNLSTFALHSNQVTSAPENQAIAEFELLKVKHSLNRNPAITRPRTRYRLFRIFLKTANGNYFRELYYLYLARYSGRNYASAS
jgi:glycosyltransferase involved in cell wall biosynthesis